MLPLLINSLQDAGINIIAFCMIPVLWWFANWRKKRQSFYKYVGLRAPTLEKPLPLLLVFAVIYFLVVTFDAAGLFVSSDPTAVYASLPFYGAGAAGLIPGLISAFIAESLAEEILFRGFVLQRFKALVGVHWAIVIQAVLCGLLHNGIYLLAGVQLSLVFHAIIFLPAALGALLLGTLNEKIFDGESIWPSILIHGLANFYTVVRACFML